MPPVSDFLRKHFKHFNARETIDAADAYIKLISKGDMMMHTLASAMSTGELGIIEAEMIRQDKVHAISCTGANLEEDVFNLYGKKYYKQLRNYKDLTKDDEMELRKNGYNRVTDVAFSDKKAIEPVAEGLMKLWKEADKKGESYFPHEYLYRFLLENKSKYSIDPKHSWMLAAAKKNLPIVVPGWGDSSLGNNFAAAILRGDIKNKHIMKNDIDYMVQLATWYTAKTSSGKRIGFFQIGGGIAGDFPICVVPMLRLDMKQKAPLWAYFCQITDSTTSYGGYSGALPNEKITWGKLDVHTPSFNIESDASVIAPLIFAIVLGY